MARLRVYRFRSPDRPSDAPRPPTRRATPATRLPMAALVVTALGAAALPLATAPVSDTDRSAMTVALNVGPGAHRGAAAAHLFAFNDLHGNIDPPTGSGGLVNGVPAGGIEYLATSIRQLRAGARRNSNGSFTVTAGDLVGASPLVSSLFHDEPTIEALNAIGVDASAIGNHEFDEGVDELLRLQRGGCHPTDGCQDGDPYAGAKFPYLAGNVVWRSNGKPILPPVQIRRVDGVPVGFVGLTLKGAPGIVNPAGITTIDFRDEVTQANRYAAELARVGVHSLVLLLHEGGTQNVASGTVADPSGCANFSGAVTDIVRGLRPEYGVVVSGHTHKSYVCRLANSSGSTSLVTSAGSAGTLVTDISVSIDRRTHRFVGADAHNIIVENGVRNPDGTWATDASGRYLRNPDRIDPKVAAIANKYRAASKPLADRIVGRITSDITNTPAASGESPLGDVIADAQLAYTRASGARIALMNPGGIRASLTYAPVGSEAPGEVTYGECFAVQPFNNLVVTQTFTGAQLKQVLEQQFAGYSGQTTTRILQVSTGLSYTYDATLPLGSRISNLTLDGSPIDPAASYPVTTNDFLASGGDGFTALTTGTNRVTATGFDVDALTAYLGSGPVGPGPIDRIKRVA